MAFYEICPYCHANLDPGEQCDCQNEKEQEKEKLYKIQRMLKVGKGGQMQMNFMEVNDA